MTRLTRRIPDDMADDQRELYEQVAEGRTVVADGQIGGPFDAWVLNPATGRRIWQLGGAIRFKPTIDRRYIELAILMTGQLWQAQFEWFAHEPMARDAGLPQPVIDAIKYGEEPTFSDDGDEACWQFCRPLLDREPVDDGIYLAAVDRFGEAGVADLITTCGFYTMVSMTLNTFAVQLPDGARNPFPAERGNGRPQAAR